MAGSADICELAAKLHSTTVFTLYHLVAAEIFISLICSTKCNQYCKQSYA